MLDLGFVHDLRKIAKMMGDDRQTMLFSATMSKQMTENSGKLFAKPKTDRGFAAWKGRR